MLLQDVLNELNILVSNSKHYSKFILKCMFGLWLVNCGSWLIGSKLNVLGNIPRTRRGMLGIIFSWIPHANFNHLFFNSIPLLPLSLVIISYNSTMFFKINIIIILLEGLLTWLFARRGNHIGASGLIAGYFGFTLVFAYKIATVVSILLAGVILYYFSGILLSFFPGEAKASWESHVFGFLAGISAFFIMNNEYFISYYNYIF